MTRKLSTLTMISFLTLFAVACGGSGGGSGDAPDGIDLEEIDGFGFAASASGDFPGRSASCDEDQVAKGVTLFTDAGNASTGPIVGIQLHCSGIGIDGDQLEFGDTEDGPTLGRTTGSGGQVDCTENAVLSGFRARTAATADPAILGVDVECVTLDLSGSGGDTEVDFVRTQTVSFGSSTGFDGGLASCMDPVTDSVGAVAIGFRTAANATRLAFGIVPECKRPTAAN